MSALTKLDAAIAAVCPILGVSVGRWNDKASWRINFKPEATVQQRADAQTVLLAFDVAAANLPPTADELEAEVQALLNGGAGPHIDWQKLLKAKFISDLAHRLGKAPGALTGAELTAERNRIAAIYKAL